jgi:F420H(2)-dependent quinone reductase
MSSAFASLEQSIFRALNAVVEPAVRHGIGSPSLTPASLIVLETTGFKSGMQRRTPLWSLCLGRYRIVSTARGERSFWVKNLVQQPRVSYYLGGRRRESEAVVITPGAPHRTPAKPSAVTRKLIELLSRYSPQGWTFVLLVPAPR